jgi:hypothetical protein
MAARKSALRAVAPDEKPPSKKPVKPKTLTEAAESGTYLEVLIAQRREMIRDVADERGPARAALHRQIALHSKEIAALQEAAEQEAAEHVAGDVEDEAFDAEAL